MASVSVQDAISALERFADEVPQELRDDEQLRKRLFDAVQKLVPEVETPPEMCQRLLYSPCEMMGAKIGVDLHIFELLTSSNKPFTTEELAEACSAEPDLLLRLLKYMASVGLLKEQNIGLWAASNSTKNLSSRHVAAGVNHKHDSVMPAWHALPSWLQRTQYKTPTTKIDTPFAQGQRAPPEQSFFSWLQEHPFNLTEFNLFMGVHRTGAQTWLDNPQIFLLLQNTENIPSDDDRVVFVDIGGGLGQQCKALRARYPELQGRVVLQDLPQVIQKTDVGDKIETMAIDFFKVQPLQGATAYYFRSVLRDWPDVQCSTIFGHIRNAMAGHSYLLIDEIILADEGASKTETQLDLTMLSVLNGEARTESRWRELLTASGLEVQQIVYYNEGAREAVIIAKKVGHQNGTRAA